MSTPNGNGITITLPPELVEEIARRVAVVLGTPTRDEWPAWMTIETVERYTDIPRSTIQKNDMPRHKPHGRLLFHRGEVDAWMRGEAP